MLPSNPEPIVYMETCGSTFETPTLMQTSFSATASPVPAYHQNQFGATLGGPVYIPKIYNGKDRTFFFVDYQGNRLVTPAPATSTVPTQNMINSGFTNLQDLITFNGRHRNRHPGPDVLSRNHS